jgi:hypothetical protein
MVWCPDEKHWMNFHAGSGSSFVSQFWGIARNNSPVIDDIYDSICRKPLNVAFDDLYDTV